MTVADLASEVVARADAWTAIGAAIESRRMGAKAAIGAARTFAAIVLAGGVDWSPLDPTAQINAVEG